MKTGRHVAAFGVGAPSLNGSIRQKQIKGLLIQPACPPEETPPEIVAEVGDYVFTLDLDGSELLVPDEAAYQRFYEEEDNDIPLKKLVRRIRRIEKRLGL